MPRLEGGWPVCRGSWNVGVGRSNPKTVLHMFEPRDVSQKHGPSPAVREAQPTICRPNAIKPDQLLSNAQRAPEVF